MTENHSYDRGDLCRLSAAFSNTAGVATDPTAVVLRVKPPSGTVVLYGYPDHADPIQAIVKDAGTGNYHVDLLITESGPWAIRWEGSGSVVTAEESTIQGKRSQF